MDEVWTLILLSLAMLVGCYVSGAIPLAFTLAEDKLRLVTVMGAGLLVGTALAVIIPEGVHTLYDAKVAHASHSHTKKSLDTEIDVHGVDSPADVDHHHGEVEASLEMHSWIGVALVLGFVFMLLVDQLSGGSHHHSTTDSEGGLVQNRKRNTATLGLVVHAAADGIALGAAATTQQTHVEMIVFIAIMLHKAPAAFGLVSFLLHEGFDRNRIRRHLALFSAAAPLLAIITYFGLSQQSKETLSDINATGMAMLFSAGTFLYVATVHVMPELLNMGNNGDKTAFTKLELTLMVIGALCPLLLSLGHHH